MVLEKIIKMVAEQFMVDESEVSADTAFVDDLGADSLDVVEMLMSLEDEYGITIEDEKVAEMKTVADVVRCVEGLIEG